MGHHDNGGQRSGRRIAASGSAVAAFLAFGLAPLATAPAARADLDWLGDLFSISDPSGGADLFVPAADALDLTAAVNQFI